MATCKELKKRIKSLETTIEQLVAQRNKAQVEAATALLMIHPEDAEDIRSTVVAINSGRIDLQLALAETKGKLVQSCLKNAALTQLLNERA